MYTHTHPHTHTHTHTHPHTHTHTHTVAGWKLRLCPRVWWLTRASTQTYKHTNKQTNKQTNEPGRGRRDEGKRRNERKDWRTEGPVTSCSKQTKATKARKPRELSGTVRGPCRPGRWPATSAPGLGSPQPTSAPGLSSPQPTSAPGLSSPQPTSAPGLGSPGPHLHRDSARPAPLRSTGLGWARLAAAPPHGGRRRERPGAQAGWNGAGRRRAGRARCDRGC